MTLITGHKGYIGSLLYEQIGGVGIDLKQGLNLLTCDLPEGIEVIYHLAAQSFVESSWHDPLHDLDNIKITARLVKQYPNAKIIYANSAAAKDPIMSPYGFSKWASAGYLKRFHDNYVICTFPNVYGKNDKSVVDIFKKAWNVVVYGDGQQLRDYVHVDDIVEGLIKAKHWEKGEYEMGSGIATSVLDLANGKNISFAPPRKEARESILKNNTPDWQPTIKVLEYIHD
jgi:nucleoside-diphosphate-sugar epimerase